MFLTQSEADAILELVGIAEQSQLVSEPHYRLAVRICERMEYPYHMLADYLQKQNEACNGNPSVAL